jgi:membrane protein required for colicin V production
MSLFDVVAGLVLLVSGLVGWIRGGVREVSGVAALAAAAILAIFALRITGPVARHAIHTAWLANVTAVVVVFVAAYVVLRVIAASFSRRIQQTTGLGAVDRTIGGGIGLVRALVLLGLANLTIHAVTPSERMPSWITGAYLYPVSGIAADRLKAFAPKGAALARRFAPAVGHAITIGDTTAGEADSPAKSLRVQVENGR